MSRGAPAVAAAALERAAELTPDPEERGKLLLHAAEISAICDSVPATASACWERSRRLGPECRNARQGALFQGDDGLSRMPQSIS